MEGDFWGAVAAETNQMKGAKLSQFVIRLCVHVQSCDSWIIPVFYETGPQKGNVSQRSLAGVGIVTWGRFAFYHTIPV